MGRRNPSYPPETSSSLRLEPRANRLTKHVVDRFNVAGFHGIERGNLAIRGTWELEAAAAYGADRGTKCTGEILGREGGRGGEGGEEEGAGGVGVRGKPGSKARRNFQQSRSLCWRAAKGVASRVYIMFLWRIPFLPSFSPRLRIGCVYIPVVKIALQVKTTLFRGEERSLLSFPHFFHFSPHFASLAFVNRTIRLR